jgi:penicillin-binding protein 2
MLPIASILLIMFVLGCTAANQSVVREIYLPTIVPYPTNEVDMQEAQRAAMGFLGAWQAQDFDSMYSLLSFASQETIGPAAFREYYENTQNTMTFEGLDFEPRAMSRVGPRTTQLSYDLNFHTRILGDIDDPGRNLTIILDPQNNHWRIAWSEGDVFAEFALGARLEFQTNAPSRANIYDRNGVIVADMQGRMVEVYAVQEDAPDWTICRETLSEVIGISTEHIDQIYAIARSDWSMRVGLIDEPSYLSQQTRLENECKATFGSMATRRYLPNGSTMAHVLGFVGFPDETQVDELIRAGFDSETILGQAGVEASWNDVLMGTPGGRLVIFNSDGTRARTLAERTPGVAESIWLTIDIDLQQTILQILSDAFGQNRVGYDGGPGWGTRSPGAAAVVFDVRTGEILAMISYPTYDANAFTAYPAVGRVAANEIQEKVANDERRPMLNRAAQGLFPAGSIFKVIDSIAVLDTGVYDPDTSYVCVGTWRYEDDIRYDWWAPGHGRVTVRTAIQQSCNPFFYQVGFVLNTADPFYLPNYARRLGLGDYTGLQDLNENPGLIPDPDVLQALYGQQWSYANAVNLAIGQGEIGVTPLQMARTYAAIANGGDLLRPRLVLQRGILNQRTFVAEPDVVSSFGIDEAVLDVVRSGLCDVTSAPLGTASHIFRDSPLMDTIHPCGKTGTAQTGQDGEQPHSWFVSYAPMDDPEIAVIVIIENAGDGSAVAAPIVKQIMEYYFLLR